MEGGTCSDCKWMFRLTQLKVKLQNERDVNIWEATDLLYRSTPILYCKEHLILLAKIGS